MKPAIETPNGVAFDSSQRTLGCLRCQQKLERYQLWRSTPMPGNSGYAVLSCTKCGHVEFVSDSSPLLQSLQLDSADVGDGD